MTPYFLERWADQGNALTAPLAAEIARIGRALNRLRINGNPATLTDRGIDLEVRAGGGGVSLPFVNIFTLTGAAVGTWTPGKVYVGGVEYSVDDLPTTIGPITESTLYWIRHAFSGGTTWESGPMAGGYPPMEENVEIYRMLELTFADGAITKIVCPQPMDIHAPARSY